MRKHGWQLPSHPLQVVAVAVFLALGFAFYVFFAPFVGKKLYQYVVTGLYTSLIICAFSLYIWCAAADPADPGVFNSKKYLKIAENKKDSRPKESKLDGDSTSSIHDANAGTIGQKHMNKGTDTASRDHITEFETKNTSSQNSSCVMALVGLFPCVSLCNCSSSCGEFSERKTSEDGMFYCSLCEVEVFKYSKHCRVCDKCVDLFDHHCRWLNNCIGKKNYRKFFTLMVSALLLLIFQWSTGIFVLIRCFLERKCFTLDIASKLGSSFTKVPFVIVVAVCTILAMIGTLPLVQLFFFHILLIKKGISTYDYIVALREQEQQGQQSAQMSPASSLTGLSSTSSFNTFHRGGAAWCTPPRLFVEDQFDVVPPDTGSVSSLGKKTVGEAPIKKKNPTPVKISPWALAHLNRDIVSKAAAESRKKSKIYQPVARYSFPFGLERDHSFGSTEKRPNPRLDSTKIRNDMITETSTSYGPFRLETGSAFRTAKIVASSPESSLDSPDQDPFGVSLSSLPANTVSEQQGIVSSRSTSDGYEASGGEDSDRAPSRFVQRSTSWSNHLFDPNIQEERTERAKASASFSEAYHRKP